MDLKERGLLFREIKKFIDDIQTDQYRGTEEIYGRVFSFVKQVSDKVFKLPPSCWEIGEEFGRNESMLYNLPEYRDHYIHQANVFLLGYYMLNRIGIDRIEEIITRFLRRKEIEPKEGINVLKAWFLASFYHDVTYAIQKMPALIEIFLQKFLGGRNGNKEETGKNVVGDGNWGLILNWNDNLRHLNEMLSYYHRGEEAKKALIDRVAIKALTDYRDHGVLSALVLLNRLGEEIEKDTATCYISALAIFLHNKLVWQDLKKEKRFEKMKFIEHPIAFLLMFCDNSQEWGRPRDSGGNLGQNPTVSPCCEIKSGRTEVRCALDYPEKVRAEMDDFIDRAPDYWSSGDQSFRFEIAFTWPTGSKTVRFP